MYILNEFLQTNVTEYCLCNGMAKYTRALPPARKMLLFSSIIITIILSYAIIRIQSLFSIFESPQKQTFDFLQKISYTNSYTTSIFISKITTAFITNIISHTIITIFISISIIIIIFIPSFIINITVIIIKIVITIISVITIWYISVNRTDISDI